MPLLQSFAAAVLRGCAHWPDNASDDCCTRAQARHILDAVGHLQPPLDTPSARLVLFLCLHATGADAEAAQRPPHALLLASMRVERALAHAVTELRCHCSATIEDTRTPRSGELAAAAISEHGSAGVASPWRRWHSEERRNTSGACVGRASLGSQHGSGWAAAYLATTPSSQIDAQGLFGVAQACESRVAVEVFAACSQGPPTCMDATASAILGVPRAEHLANCGAPRRRPSASCQCVTDRAHRPCCPKDCSLRAGLLSSPLPAHDSKAAVLLRVARAQIDSLERTQVPAALALRAATAALLSAAAACETRSDVALSRDVVAHVQRALCTVLAAQTGSAPQRASAAETLVALLHTLRALACARDAATARVEPPLRLALQPFAAQLLDQNEAAYLGRDAAAAPAGRAWAWPRQSAQCLAGGGVADAALQLPAALSRCGIKPAPTLVSLLLRNVQQNAATDGVTPALVRSRHA